MSVTDSWTTSSTLEEIAAWLKDAGRVLLLTHTKPDGDAIGSTVAVARALEQCDGAPGRNATVWYAGPLPSWTKLLGNTTKIKTVEADGAPDPANFGGCIVLDTGAWNQLEPYADSVRGFEGRVAVVDHHLQGDADVAPMRVLDTKAGAVCETAAELCRLLLGLESLRDLPKDIATPLYLGIATDTGWFRFSNVSPRTMRIAADLIEAGAEPARLYSITEQRDGLSRYKLMSRALSSLELFDRGRVAVMALSTADMHAAHAGPGDSGGFADQPLSIESVAVSVLLIEVEAGKGQPARVKMSLRSKDCDEPVDVNVVAQKFGGGGHARAAGARADGSLQEVWKRIIEALTS